MHNINCFLRMPEGMAEEYKFSDYNVYLDEKRGLVYNTRTQVISEFEEKEIRQDYLDKLVECGFIVEKKVNEVVILKSEYDCREELSEELHLIIALTLDCQFRCIYCYENHTKVYMESETKQAIVKLVRDYARRGKNISVVWYGGEPMLDFSTLRKLTEVFMKICGQYDVKYSASMISNGYLFDDESISKLDSLNILSIQITVDGMKAIHEIRRPMSNGRESFDCIINNMISICTNSNVHVHLRINVDKYNIQSAYDLVKYCARLGLGDIDVNLGMVKDFGCEHSCGNCDRNLFSMKEFAEEFIKFRVHLKKWGFHNAVDKMKSEYKINSCIMDAPDAYLIDPNGFVYKCISKVGQAELSIGNVRNGFDTCAHMNINPFDFEMCVKCKYFPICKGGCLIKNAGRHKECNIWKFLTEDLILLEID